jgi:cysteinyl-tRNA synthetase
MIPTGNIHRLPAIDCWQSQPKIKNALLQRVKNITSEIHSLQEEMHAKLAESTREHQPLKFFEDGSAAQVLNDFKAELDQVRRILWFYIEEAAGNRAVEPDEDRLDTRLQRVNELLRTLALHPSHPATAEAESKTSVSFFERLEEVIDTYMEKKPVAQAKAAKAGD